MPLTRRLGDVLRRVLRPHRSRRCIEIDAVCAGQRMSVWVGEYYVRLSIDGRDYYFDRLTGHYDGTGSPP